MTVPAEWRCDAATLASGGTTKFRLERRGRAIEAFIVARDGEYYAYVNRCPHVGTPLDLWPNEFLSEDGQAIVCSTHGAMFEPTTGRCTAGPCAGDGLIPLEVCRDGDRVVVRVRDR
jgi:naringenin degradation protein FdeD